MKNSSYGLPIIVHRCCGVGETGDETIMLLIRSYLRPLNKEMTYESIRLVITFDQGLEFGYKGRRHFGSRRIEFFGKSEIT